MCCATLEQESWDPISAGEWLASSGVGLRAGSEHPIPSPMAACCCAYEQVLPTFHVMPGWPGLRLLNAFVLGPEAACPSIRDQNPAECYYAVGLAGLEQQGWAWNPVFPDEKRGLGHCTGQGHCAGLPLHPTDMALPAGGSPCQ